MKKLIFAIALLAVAYLAAVKQFEVKVPSVTEDSSLLAKDEQLCDLKASLDEMADSYEAMQEAKWDLTQIGCGAVYAYEAAQDSVFDIELKLMALGAQVTYFIELDKRYPKIYQEGELAKQLNRRWDAAKARSENLIKQAQAFDFIAPEVKALHSIYLLTSTAQNTTTKVQLKTLPVARDLMKDAIANDEQVLDGMGMQVMAKLYTDLPVFVGGDLEKGLAMFEKLLIQQPDNLELHALMIEGYLAKGDVTRQQQLVKLATQIDSSALNLQDRADLYNTLGGMANRLDSKEAILHFRSARERLFKKNPQLQARKFTAALGHGGNDPITGKDPNEI